MMKHIIICGDQATGKTLLAGQMRQMSEHIVIRDGVNRDEIVMDERRNNLQYIYTTNEKITYKHVDREEFLIIKLTDIETMTSNKFVIALQDMKYMVQEEVLGENNKQIFLEGNFFADNLRFVLYRNGTRLNDHPKAHWKLALQHFNAVKL